MHALIPLHRNRRTPRHQKNLQDLQEVVLDEGARPKALLKGNSRWTFVVLWLAVMVYEVYILDSYALSKAGFLPRAISAKSAKRWESPNRLTLVRRRASQSYIMELYIHSHPPLWLRGNPIALACQRFSRELPDCDYD